MKPLASSKPRVGFYFALELPEYGDGSGVGEVVAFVVSEEVEDVQGGAAEEGVAEEGEKGGVSC